MEILIKDIMLDGTKIQLEKWDDKFYIGAYPVARNTSKHKWIQDGRVFRLTIPENHYKNYTGEMVKNDYESLKNGLKTLQDLSSYFWNGEKDMWYLGMDVKNRDY